MSYEYTCKDCVRTLRHRGVGRPKLRCKECERKENAARQKRWRASKKEDTDASR